MMFQAVTAAVGVAITAIALFLFVSFLWSWPVYMLWNGCLVGAVAGVAEVTWLQAWGLDVLSGMLFKSHVSTDSKS
jgi:hypothetical protein